jgi:hypothetical protein
MKPTMIPERPDRDDARDCGRRGLDWRLLAAKLRVRRGLAILALVAGAAAPAPAQQLPAPKPEPEKAAEPAKGPLHKVEGFRSARFGMTEQQVRDAIRKDFGLSGDAVTVEEQPIEKTTVLGVTVPDLLPDAGPARISYILGYKSKKLIQVNLLWGTPLGAVTAEEMRAAAAALGRYFAGLNFAPEAVIANARLADGSWLVFQGADAQKRAAVLRFAATEAEEGKTPSVVMTLFYIQDTEKPDVFRIGRGQF